MEIAFFVTLGLVAFAAAVDVFFLTGIWFSGLFLLATVGGLYTTGQIDILTTLPIVFVVTLATNCINFYLGRSGSNVPLIQKQLARPQVQSWSTKINNLSPHALFITMGTARFVGVIRPFYALVLGAAQVPPRRFVQYEIILAAAWTSIWGVFIYLVANGILAIT